MVHHHRDNTPGGHRPNSSNHRTHHTKQDSFPHNETDTYNTYGHSHFSECRSPTPTVTSSRQGTYGTSSHPGDDYKRMAWGEAGYGAPDSFHGEEDALQQYLSYPYTGQGQHATLQETKLKASDNSVEDWVDETNAVFSITEEGDISDTYVNDNTLWTSGQGSDASATDFSSESQRFGPESTGEGDPQTTKRKKPTRPKHLPSSRQTTNFSLPLSSPNQPQRRG